MHRHIKDTLDERSATYESSQRKVVLEEWELKLDEMRIYIEGLQERIRVEQGAKEELAKLYEIALNKGVT